MSAIDLAPPADVAETDAALDDLLGFLLAEGYRFTTPNRSTHATVSARRAASEADLLRDIFGWSRPFSNGALPLHLKRSLEAVGLIRRSGEGLVADVRVSSVGENLFAHSSLRGGQDAVFLGPDSYRFARFLKQVLSDGGPFSTALDVGTGAGVGAITLLREGLARRVTGTDINAQALRFAAANARAAKAPLATLECDGLPAGNEPFDLIVANPPFIAGDHGAVYRDGGDRYGAAKSLDWADAAVKRLNPGGRLVLYTGAPIVAGEDIVRRHLAAAAASTGMNLSYDEIDPDIFGSSLKLKAYQDVERIAAVGAVMTAP